MLADVAKEMNLAAKRMKGEAALYGPKLDFMFKDSLGKEIQIPTVQLDFATAKRFDLTYVDEKGKKINPVMVHRAILGSYERFLALLIEHFAGAFPIWLAPVQVWLIPVGNRHKKYAQQIAKQLQEENLRFELKDDNETVSKKIREGELQKIPYLLVVGDKEEKSGSVGVRNRKKGDLGPIKTNKFIERIKQEITDKAGD